MTKAHRLLPRKLNKLQTVPGSAGGVPINFLLGCSNDDLGNYELARLADVADLRRQVQALIDQINEQMGLAWLAAWFKAMDRAALKEALENEESAFEWAKRMIRERQRGEGENDPIPPLPPGAAHLAAALRYQERNIAEGKCSVCPNPQDPNSVRYCTKHLAIMRARHSKRRGVKGQPGSPDYLYGELPESTHGRQPGTLAALAMNREKATRALCAELGISPDSAAVSLKAAVEALEKCMPQSEAEAMTQKELFEKAGIITNSTGQKALKQLFAEDKIDRIGRGVNRDPYRYFASEQMRANPVVAGKEKNRILLQTLQGEKFGEEK